MKWLIVNAGVVEAVVCNTDGHDLRGREVVSMQGADDDVVLAVQAGMRVEYSDGVLQVSLPPVIADLCAQIDAAAGALIETLLPHEGGIRAAHEAKRREADRWGAGKSPQRRSGDYPFILAEARVRGVSPADVADSVRAAVARWQEAVAAVEATRVSGKARVRECGNPAAARMVAEEVLRALVV